MTLNSVGRGFLGLATKRVDTLEKTVSCSSKARNGDLPVLTHLWCYQSLFSVYLCIES